MSNRELFKEILYYIISVDIFMVGVLFLLCCVYVITDILLGIERSLNYIELDDSEEDEDYKEYDEITEEDEDDEKKKLL